MFNVTVLTSERIVYEGRAWSVFTPGAAGEFEILEFHRPIISLLKEGNIIIDWKEEIPIKSGAARLLGNYFVALVEE